MKTCLYWFALSRSVSLVWPLNSRKNIHHSEPKRTFNVKHHGAIFADSWLANPMSRYCRSPVRLFVCLLSVCHSHIPGKRWPVDPRLFHHRTDLLNMQLVTDCHLNRYSRFRAMADFVSDIIFCAVVRLYLFSLIQTDVNRCKPDMK